MNAQEFRTLFIFVAVLCTIGGGLVTWQYAKHPVARVTAHEDIRSATAAPKTPLKGQVFYEQERAAEWAQANSGNREMALPAWAKVLQRFRFNVVGSQKESALEQLKEAEAWRGKITGDAALDARIIEAAVLSRFNRESNAWVDLEKELKAAAPNTAIDAALKANGH